MSDDLRAYLAEQSTATFGGEAEPETPVDAEPTDELPAEDLPGDDAAPEEEAPDGDAEDLAAEPDGEDDAPQAAGDPDADLQAIRDERDRLRAEAEERQRQEQAARAQAQQIEYLRVQAALQQLEQTDPEQAARYRAQIAEAERNRVANEAEEARRYAAQVQDYYEGMPRALDHMKAKYGLTDAEVQQVRTFGDTNWGNPDLPNLMDSVASVLQAQRKNSTAKAREAARTQRLQSGADKTGVGAVGAGRAPAKPVDQMSLKEYLDHQKQHVQGGI